MNQWSKIGSLFVAAAVVGAHAQGRGAGNPDQADYGVVGCLSQSASDWILTNATSACADIITTPEALEGGSRQAARHAAIPSARLPPYNPTEHKVTQDRGARPVHQERERDAHQRDVLPDGGTELREVVD